MSEGWGEEFFNSKQLEIPSIFHQDPLRKRILIASQISHVVADSTWEAYTAAVLEKREEVQSFAKNDHFGFNVYYLWRGSKRKYVPDFLINFANGKHLVLEIKGEDSEQNRAKRMALDVWVRAVNSRGGFGTWCWDVVKGEPARVDDVIVHHSKSSAFSEPVGEAGLEKLFNSDRTNQGLFKLSLIKNRRLMYPFKELKSCLNGCMSYGRWFRR